MKYLHLLLILFTGWSFAQPPAGYYESANGLTGYALKSALESIIDSVDDGNGQPFHDITLTYSQLWTLYETSDVRPDGFVWEMYSNCDFTFVTDQDTGTGGGSECDKFNREHTFARSWFDNDTDHPIFADAFHVIPSDKKVNAERGNLAFGEVASPIYTSLNGTLIGSSSLSGPAGNVFEPIDTYKGDIARGLFYLAVRYQDDIASWEANDIDGDSMLDGSSDKVFEQWALDMLYSWHLLDPVSQKEIDRNNAIFAHQDNRNPFIDNPQYVEDIWEGTLSVNEAAPIAKIQIYPNPVTNGYLNIKSTKTVNMEIFNLIGQRIIFERITPNHDSIDLGELAPGLYL
ncbi:MAG: T9SS type A sorting domain-containing protein, partial [Flavobacteriaceae bacterium]|nr:T9SS type A sorting domain-containing protein [Flavobacteriaceae bacterium]